MATNTDLKLYVAKLANAVASLMLAMVEEKDHAKREQHIRECSKILGELADQILADGK